jgi:hypothetical protein
MKSLNINKIALASALVAGSLIPISVSAQVVTLYSGAPGTIAGGAIPGTVITTYSTLA